MTKEVLQKAYEEIVKAEKGALEGALETLRECGEKLDKELEKLPSPVFPGTSAFSSLQNAKMSLEQQSQALQQALGFYQSDRSEGAAMAPPFPGGAPRP